MQKQPRGTGITGTAGLLSCCAALRPAAGGDVGAHAALLPSLLPNFGTLVRALSTRPPVALANSARLWRAAFRRTVLSVVSTPAAVSARYRFFHLRTLRSLVRCIWLISYRVYSLPLYSMFRAFSSSSWSRVHAGGSPSSGNTAKKVWRQFQPHSPAPQNPDA